MTITMQVIQIIFQSVAIIFMICFMFIGIWSFILFLKIAKNQRIQTYLLEKINRSISTLQKVSKNEPSSNSDFLIDDLIPNDDNIKKFDNNIE